ncbi:MAG: PP2C family protein-serine/threonine phosphatase [Terracidiphilus sp.]
MAQKSAAVFAPAVAFSAAGIGTGSRAIDGLWQFHLGDDPDGKLGWAQPGFDDSKWERVPADRPWAYAGHWGYTGYAWYRRQIALDPTDKNPLALLLPPLDTVAEVYWNGAKVGGIGTVPPNASWRFREQPASIPLPTAPGASSGTLSIRIWMVSFTAMYAPDTGGFWEAPQLGYAPVIQQMRESFVEHYLREHAIQYGACVLFLCAGLTSLVLWLRLRSQWILLCVGAYFISYVIPTVLHNTISTSARVAEYFAGPCDCINDIALLFLILLLARLPKRRGVRGLGFWRGVCLVGSALQVLSVILGPWGMHLADSDVLFLPLVVIGCLVLSKPRLPRLLFMVAAGLDVLVWDVSGVLSNYPSLSWIEDLLPKLSFHIYGSDLIVFVTSKLLLLAAIVYAVWDQLSRDLAEQRRANAELKAAQEVQKVLIAAEERGAPGYAVASVYRPANEVGGDFFQVIPLEEDGTLIVAGDVSGKGLRAAMTVSLIVGAVRTLAEQDSSPGAVLAGLNRRLVGRTKGGFATCCAVRVDPAGHAAMANAGHCQPYLDDREVELPAGLPLGLVDGMTYEEVVLTIAYGQQLTLVSDGVVEARNHRGELYGFDRLSQLMRQRPSAERVADTAIDFGQDDDITVLTVTRLSPEPDAAVQLSELSPAPA